MKILNFGSMNLDYVYSVPHFVQPGETLSATHRSICFGGKGLNQSIALARAGVQVFHGGCVGAGGESLCSLLRENGVDVSLLASVQEMQGHTVIQVNPQGENCILLFGGSNRCVTESQILSTLASFSPGDWLVLQNEISGLEILLREAHRKGMVTVLNPSPFEDSIRSLDLGNLSWMLVNEIEVAQLTGTSDPEAAFSILHTQYPGLSLLVTLGSHGSVAFRQTPKGTEIAKEDALSVKCVDTTGAGDTYTGYFLAGLIQGLSLQESMHQASLAAAISVTRPGAADSIPWRKECGF